MPLKIVREKLNIIDTAIKNLLVLRMSLIPIVAEIKLKNNLSMFQPQREQQMYESMEKFCEEKGVDKDLIKNVYHLIIENALKIEHKLETNNPPYNLDVKVSENKEQQLSDDFLALEKLLYNDLDSIIHSIEELLETKETTAENLSELATYHYRQKCDNQK